MVIIINWHLVSNYYAEGCFVGNYYTEMCLVDNLDIIVLCKCILTLVVNVSVDSEHLL